MILRSVVESALEKTAQKIAMDAAISALKALAKEIEPGDSGFKIKYEYIPDFISALESEPLTEEVAL